MKKKLLLTTIILLIGIATQTVTASEVIKINKLSVAIVDPSANITGNATICPGNTAVISITGTPISIVALKDTTTNTIYTANILASGTGVFTTPVLNQTTMYSLESVSELATGITTNYTGITVLITVVPNGCASVNTNGTTAINTIAICEIGECRTLTAAPTPIASTTSYEVSSIPYCPQAAFADPTYNQINVTVDDIWSSTITLPFNFCFFNNNYSTCQVGSNGVISFNNNVSPGFCPWTFTSSVPSPTFPILNAIYGVYQDLNPSSIPTAPAVTSINWKLIGTYPCRKLIVNFSNVGQYQCNNSVGLQTSQIVLYEVSNIIDVYIQRRQSCTTWNSGSGVVGIQNAAGTIGYTPAGRNTGAWNATNEAWRFTPNGPSVPMTFQWLENGIPISNNLTTSVCPTQTSTYIAQAQYSLCGVPITVNSPDVSIYVQTDQTSNAVDISLCYSSTEIYIANLTINDAIILGALNPNEYEIVYFTTLLDAQQFSNPIPTPTTYSFTQNEIIYAGIFDINYGCTYTKSFALSISDPVVAPSGISPQYFTSGQLLSDIIITGSNILWYDAPQEGNQLPPTTVIQNNTTYYASQTMDGCEGRNVNSNRLAITTFTTLNNPVFDIENIIIQPNPFENIITISSINTINQIEVYNTLGQKVMTKKCNQNELSMDLSYVNSGVYFLKAFSNEKTTTFKIIKK